MFFLLKILSKHHHHFNYQNQLKLFSTLKQQKKLYIQGQNDPEKPKIREYFYYIDHNGFLFLDDSRMKNFTSCFKEKVFLNFFFRNIKKNNSGRYEKEFPYISLCGIERNFIRCDDVPIVYTHIVPNPEPDPESKDSNPFNLIIAYSDLVYPFKPETLYMLPESSNDDNSEVIDEDAAEDNSNLLKHGGRIYHEAKEKYGNYGLIRSQLAQELSNLFILNEQKQPIKFKWNEKEFNLTNQLKTFIIH